MIMVQITHGLNWLVWWDYQDYSKRMINVLVFIPEPGTLTDNCSKQAPVYALTVNGFGFFNSLMEGLADLINL
jgi:hypothetical protein